MKALTLILTLLLSLPLYAAPQGNGTFYDPSRNGEGMYILTRNGNVHIAVFTYDTVCDDVVVEEIIEEACHKETSWYVSGAYPMVNGQAQGVLYTGLPYEFPDGDDLADVVAIGWFVLVETETGYALQVLQSGDVLPPSSEIYARIFDFSEFVFGPTE